MPDQPTPADRDRLGVLIHRALRHGLLAADVALDLPRRERCTQDLLDALAPELAAAWGEGYAEARNEVTAEADRAYWRGHELARRQATEGWDRRWAVEEPWRTPFGCDDEADAREAVAHFAPGSRVVSRLVGPWEPDEPKGSSA